MDPVATIHLPAAEVGPLKNGQTVVLRGKVVNVGDEISIEVSSVTPVKVLQRTKPTSKPEKTVSTLEYLRKVNPEPITPVPSLAV